MMLSACVRAGNHCLILYLFARADLFHKNLSCFNTAVKTRVRDQSKLSDLFTYFVWVNWYTPLPLDFINIIFHGLVKCLKNILMHSIIKILN